MVHEGRRPKACTYLNPASPARGHADRDGPLPKATTKPIGKALKSKTGRTIRHGLQITTDGVLLSWLSYDIVKEIVAAKKVKRALDVLNELKKQRELRKKEQSEKEGGGQQQEEQQPPPQVAATTTTTTTTTTGGWGEAEWREEWIEGLENPKSDWFYIHPETEQQVWLETLDEAIRLYELGQEIYVSPRGQRELLLGGESEEEGEEEQVEEGRNRRRRAAEEEGEEGSYY